MTTPTHFDTAVTFEAATETHRGRHDRRRDEFEITPSDDENPITAPIPRTLENR